MIDSVPSGFARLIEDKMWNHQMELRDVTISADLSSLHKNSERPAFYPAWVAVQDTVLPLKGTGHRAGRHDSDAVKPAMINDFAQSELWRLQGICEALPVALTESQFHVPSARSHLSGNDARKNLTDFQETSQWLAGDEFWSRIIQSLVGPLSFH